jgi:hypothetical protein
MSSEELGNVLKRYVRSSNVHVNISMKNIKYNWVNSIAVNIVRALFIWSVIVLSKDLCYSFYTYVMLLVLFIVYTFKIHGQWVN